MNFRLVQHSVDFLSAVFVSDANLLLLLTFMEIQFGNITEASEIIPDNFLVGSLPKQDLLFGNFLQSQTTLAECCIKDIVLMKNVKDQLNFDVINGKKS